MIETKRKKSSSELFCELALTMKEVYNNDDSFDSKINDSESRKLARNIIDCCQKFIEIQIRIERDQENKLEPG